MGGSAALAEGSGLAGCGTCVGSNRCKCRDLASSPGKGEPLETDSINITIKNLMPLPSQVRLQGGAVGAAPVLLIKPGCSTPPRVECRVGAFRRSATLSFYLTSQKDDFDKISELQVCIAEALYDAEAVLSNPAAFKAEEIRTLRDQITSNLERAWEITGRSEDELTGVMVQISQVVALELCTRKN